MYEQFFNLSHKPFDLAPNPQFLYLSSSHKRAITYLDYGIGQRAGFILLTGEIGSGKTTILRNLLKKLDDRALEAKIFNTKVSSEQLFAMINEDFGLPAQGRDRVTLLRELNDFLIEQYSRGRLPTLIIDEAQNLNAELLEEIRLLSNLETDSVKLLQIILAGQPELQITLDAPELLQLRQRISISCAIGPLKRSEAEEYILYRLEIAGNRQAAQFSPAAIDLVYNFSKGIPRLINIICDFIMLSAYADQTSQINETMVSEIASELNFERQYWGISSSKQEEAPKIVSAKAVAGESMLADQIASIGKQLESFQAVVQQENADLRAEMGKKFCSFETAFEEYVEATNTSLEDLHGRIKQGQERKVVESSKNLGSWLKLQGF